MNAIAIYENKRLTVKAGLGALRFSVFPAKSKRGKAAVPGKNVKAAKGEKPKQNFPMPESEFIFSTLDKLRKRLVIRDLDVGYMPPGGDPMAAAMINALINETAGILLPAMNNLFRVKKSRVVVTPNFYVPSDKLYVKLHLSMSVFSALTLGLGAYMKYNKFRKSLEAAEPSVPETKNKTTTETTYERKEQ